MAEIIRICEPNEEVATPVEEKINAEEIADGYSKKSKSTKRREAIQKEEGPQITKDDILLDLLNQFTAPVPQEYITEYQDKGTTFKGYQSQYAINLLNKVVGLDGWMFNVTIKKEEMGNKGWAIAMEGELIINYKDIQFVRFGSGGSYAIDIANAYKGARTSCFKNACRYLGIGQELYSNVKDDDIVYEEVKEVQSVIELNGDASDIDKKIGTAENIEQLKTLEERIKAVREEGIMKVLLKKYNDKKISLMTK